MLEHQRREPRHIFGPDGITLSGELLQSSVDVQGVPENNDVHNQAQGPQLGQTGPIGKKCKLSALRLCGAMAGSRVGITLVGYVRPSTTI